MEQSSCQVVLVSLITVAYFSSNVILHVKGQYEEMFSDSLSDSFQDLSSAERDLSHASEENKYLDSLSDDLDDYIKASKTLDTTTHKGIKRIYWHHGDDFNEFTKNTAKTEHPIQIKTKNNWQREETTKNTVGNNNKDDKEHFHGLTNNVVAVEQPDWLQIKRKYNWLRQEMEMNSSEKKKIENDIFNEVTNNAAVIQQPIHNERRNNWALQEKKNSNMNNNNVNNIKADKKNFNELTNNAVAIEQPDWIQIETSRKHLETKKNDHEIVNVDEPTNNIATIEQPILMARENTRELREMKNGDVKNDEQVDTENLVELTNNVAAIEQPDWLQIERKNNREGEKAKHKNFEKKKYDAFEREILNELTKITATMEPTKQTERKNKWQEEIEDNSFEKINKVDSENVHKKRKHKNLSLENLYEKIKQPIPVGRKNFNNKKKLKINTWQKADYRIETYSMR